MLVGFNFPESQQQNIISALVCGHHTSHYLLFSVAFVLCLVTSFVLPGNKWIVLLHVVYNTDKLLILAILGKYLNTWQQK
jgi:hypothetical protein